MSTSVVTLAQTLAQRADSTPETGAFTYLLDGESAEAKLTYGELHLRAQTLAAQLRERLAPGARVLLLLPPGFEYLEAVFACFYANVIGVSAAPPQPKRLHRTLPRLLAIAADAQVDGVLCTAEIRDAAQPLLAEGPLADATWFVADRHAPAIEDWSIPAAEPHEVAFLQYTSGSTAQPRGVMLTHANLLTNLELIGQRFDAAGGIARGGKLLIWLPPYHDMGLIGGLLQSVYSGFPVILMSPIAVIKRPERWLQAISRYGATASGGPNFSYDLCVRRIRPEIREQLDLSGWDTAFNGAEPIRASTINAFCEAFAPCGFQRSAFLPCYGLAEATLLVTGNKRPDGPTIASFDSDALLDGRLLPPQPGHAATTLVGCGNSADDHEVAIVDPHTLQRCPPGRIGEIWVSGPSVAPGYWNQPESAADFQAQVAGEAAETAFLRTGDLGAIEGDDLFVTGRIKELLILHGRNIHPHDLEQSAEGAHPALRQHCSAAFAIEDDERAEVALVLEVKAGTDGLEEIMSAVRRRVAADYDVQTQLVALVAPGGVPKTTSGKIQRIFTRELLIAGELEPLAIWRTGEGG
jgi:acyl-CoA synthetase (AMP-forming)/AMP-acid ligase II